MIKNVHGPKLKRTYAAWSNMKDRCLNRNCVDYHYYGGRGVTVCDRWLSFENFYNDMQAVLEGKSLDRINNDGNYEPFNCRWANVTEQRQNRGNPKGYSYKKNRGKYQARIKVCGKKHNLGCFDTEKEASEAYQKARKEFHIKSTVPELTKRLHRIWDVRQCLQQF